MPERDHLRETLHKRPGDDRDLRHLIAVSVAPVLGVDAAAGVIRVAYIDADDGTPVLDIKPYLPCTERVRGARVPAWCSHWPQRYEENEGFDWRAEFTGRE